MDVSPFESIESAQQFVELLIESVKDARTEIEAEIGEAGATLNFQRRQACFLVVYQLNMLSTHLTKSHRILNDLRSLRRILLQERVLGSKTVPADVVAPADRIDW